ncbi:fibrinogen-like protein 1 [Pecten maximus]|uniref:fibrinogen-like protein 1 n=1 Tax=Pecten maximus TaxID=6579 RepID=UPI0014584942|nr:fibrinogen-like protein 1 [Pecten maximus]
MINIWPYLVTLTILLVYPVPGYGQTHLYQELDSHGMRLTALEGIVFNLTNTCTNIQQNYEDIKKENGLLKTAVQNLTARLEALEQTGTGHAAHSSIGGLSQHVTHMLSSTAVSTSPTTTVSTTSPTTTESTTPTTTESTSPTIPVSTSPTTTESTTPTTTESTTPTTTESTSPTTTESTTPTTTESTTPTTTVSTPNNNIMTKTTSTLRPKATPKDCAHAQRMGSIQSGVYRIQPSDGVRTFEVYCDLEHDGGGWTTIQRRVDGTENFERNWNDYKSGFGNVSRNFWIGNDLLHSLTNEGHMTLRVNIEDWNRLQKWAEYRDFNVGSESSWYQLSVGKYTGTAGDSFHYPASSLLRHDGMKFSTPDCDKDHSFQHCGRLLKSGWWFNSCYSSNLNGPYLTQPSGNHIYGESWGQPSMDGTGIEWYPWRKHQYSF